MSSVNCTGMETHLEHCPSSSTPSCASMRNDAGVVCQAIETLKGNCTTGSIRLVNGSNDLEGRVEVCVSDAWGTVCDSRFSEDQAAVICNTLGVPYNGMHRDSFLIAIA